MDCLDCTGLDSGSDVAVWSSTPFQCLALARIIRLCSALSIGCHVLELFHIGLVCDGYRMLIGASG